MFVCGPIVIVPVSTNVPTYGPPAAPVVVNEHVVVSCPGTASCEPSVSPDRLAGCLSDGARRSGAERDREGESCQSVAWGNTRPAG